MNSVGRARNRAVTQVKMHNGNSPALLSLLNVLDNSKAACFKGSFDSLKNVL